METLFLAVAFAEKPQQPKIMFMEALLEKLVLQNTKRGVTLSKEPKTKNISTSKTTVGAALLYAKDGETPIQTFLETWVKNLAQNIPLKG